MKVMGIEFAGSTMFYVLVELDGKNEVLVLQKNKLVLGETRARDSLVAFQAAVSTLFNSASPDLIGIKAKPEAGAMKAGAAALKMEGIVLANSPCEVDFVSGARINKITSHDEKLFAYLQPALKAARAAIAKHFAKHVQSACGCRDGTRGAASSLWRLRANRSRC
jgi:hypothetical protein